MLRLRLLCILSVVVLHLSKAERRVLDGKTLSFNRKYVVYLIKAEASVPYDAWMCGGAIVSSWYIVTSAACVEDVKHMYAIAGYTKYVKYENLDQDPCTKLYKKKIVYVCLPSEYDFDYPKVERWANIDIALVKVESEYDFKDSSYKTHCSYPPGKIEINYDPKLQEPGTNALVFGWGHTKKWRNVDDQMDYNTNDIQYGAVKLANKEKCKKYFDESKVKMIIDKYMICSMDEGALDDSGGLLIEIDGPQSFKTSCAPGALRVGDKCIADLTLRRNFGNESAADARRRGICQNDHGGPLITWRGPREVLIGIASVFRVQGSTKECIPPFLYTSTHCNGAFLNCLMNEHSRDTDRLLKKQVIERCDTLAKEGGFKIIRRSISWSMHPDGPAENEILSVSSVSPISFARQLPDKAVRKTKFESDPVIRQRPLLTFKELGLQ